ncbi:MAG: hypothetical protein SOU84_01390 [Candidatus Faecimonas sp.]|nr:hypothetical protein [Mycoplasmatota bacterium]MDY2907790.1 hypothetical protein [Candidatus Faecimonas sp.]
MAVSKYVREHQEERKIVCKKTGKIVDVSSMSDDIANDLIESAQIHLGGPNSSITNQDTMTYTLGQDHKQSGVFMLGNRGFKLSTGIMLLLLNFKKQ